LFTLLLPPPQAASRVTKAKVIEEIRILILRLV
jgi:hypothetical protein